MENIFHQKSHNRAILQNRIQLIQNLTSDFHNHILFRDTLNFNFLLHLYSSKLEDLYNSLPEISDQEFTYRMDLLTQSIDQIKDYIVR